MCDSSWGVGVVQPGKWIGDEVEEFSMPHVPQQRPKVPERVRSPSRNLEDRTQSHLRYYLYTSLFGLYANYSLPLPQSPKHPDPTLVSPILSMDIDTDQVQDDVEKGLSVSLPHIPPHSATRALGRSATPPVSSPRQYTQNDGFDSEVEEETFPNDNETPSAQIPRDNLRMNSQHRRNTSSSSQTVYDDPSAKIWGLYLSQAKKVDKEHSDSWTANTDGVLVFSGLFSATVAAFILVSYQNLQPNPSDTTNRLLSQISQQLSALSSGTPMSAPLILPDNSSFQPTASAVRVNVLWFISLALSTVCALWATLMQQWTRRYVQAVDRPYAPPSRARIRAFFAEGVEKFGLAAAVEMLPAILHTSFLLFYIGLVDFFYNINDTVAHCLLALVALGVVLYAVLSIMPLFYPNSPYQTPLSTVLWFVMEAAPLVKHWLRSQTDFMRDRQRRIGLGMRRALEKTAFNLSWQVDARALRWTLNSLDGDRELEEGFLSALPGVFCGTTSQDPQVLKKIMHKAVNSVAHELLATCSTGLLPEPARKQRLAACLGAIWCFPETTKRHCDAIRDQWSQATNDPWGALSTEAWAMAANMTMDPDPLTAFRAHCVQAMIAVMWRNGRWICPTYEASALLQRQLNASSITIEGYLAGRDHLELAVAANLLSKALRLLPLLETSPKMSFRIEMKKILDMMCERLDVSDVPEDLQTRFVNRAEVMMAYDALRDSRRRRAAAAFDMDGPWTKIFSPVYDTISERSSREIET